MFFCENRLVDSSTAVMCSTNVYLYRPNFTDVPTYQAEYLHVTPPLSNCEPHDSLHSESLISLKGVHEICPTAYSLHHEERKPTRCNNIDDLLSIVDVDY